jgi:hypothetical protein
MTVSAGAAEVTPLASALAFFFIFSIPPVDLDRTQQIIMAEFAIC